MASILLAGGGTAGHVNPLLATASALAHRGHSVAALGTLEGLEADLVPRAGLSLHIIPKVPLPRRPSLEWLRLPGALAHARSEVGRAIEATGADAVVGFGGYVSAPAYLEARRRGVPIVVHEANARPGFANRLGARYAARVAITFPDTPLRGGELIGLPLRPEIASLADTLAVGPSAARARAEARAQYGWRADAPTLLVTGGSLGAASLNRATALAAPTLVEHGLHVIHLTGRGKASQAERARADLPASVMRNYFVAEYAHDMAAAFAAADAVVCRAGAATVSEISALGLPAVYVPLPHGNGEQALNAGPAVEAGAAVLIRDAELTAASLEQQAERLILDPHVSEAMRAAAEAVGIRDGASRLAKLVEEAMSR